MQFSRARTALAGLVVAPALVLGATSAAQAAPVADTAATATVAARKAPAPKVVKAKKRTVKLATKKQRKYREVRAYVKRTNGLPPRISKAAQQQVRKGIKRLARLKVRVAKAKKLKRVKALNAKIRAQRPADTKKLVTIAKRAVQAAQAGDAGLLESLLDDLLGLDIDQTLLAPVVGIVDELLGALTSGNAEGVGGLLDGLLGLLDDLLGGLLLGGR